MNIYELLFAVIVILGVGIFARIGYDGAGVGGAIVGGVAGAILIFILLILASRKDRRRGW